MTVKQILRDLKARDWEKSIEVLRLKNQGLSYQEVADRLGMKRQQAHLTYQKMKTMSVKEAEAIASHLGKLPIDSE